MKKILKAICIVGVICGFFTKALGQTKSVYIRLDESVAPIAGNSDTKRTSIHELSNNSSIKLINALGVRSSNNSGRIIQTRSSKYLRGIYRLDVSEALVDSFLDSIISYNNVLEAEIGPDLEVLLIPNDNLVSDQNYLSIISAFQAWDIAKGDENLVIGVSDTGFDLDHEDLVNKIYSNEFDPVNGLDDDNNGYVDDYLGWDFSDVDNDVTYPSNESNSHGSNVAGVIAAEANNAIGIAGLSYDSKFLPLKISRSSDGQLINAYESIIYAADMGCAVVNLSWGSTGIPSSILQSVIDYAVLEKDMVVVAAAGNTNADLDFYPASYNHVLSVGVSAIDDSKSSIATYSYKVDLMAPGISILSTNIDDIYSFNTGSSFSSPLVAATAALVKSVYPEYDAIQVMEHIRMTTDDIYDVASNSDYYGKLGKGRLNVLRAVSDANVGAMRLYDQSINSTFEEFIFPEDTLEIVLSFVNILRNLQDVEVLIESESPYLDVINGQILLGDLYNYDSINNVTVRAVISGDAPASESMSIRLNYSDNQDYSDFEYMVVQTAPSYLELDNGVLSNTISSEGNLGYVTDGYADGSGLQYSELAHASVLGFMMAQSVDSVFDNVFNSISEGIRDVDFVSNENIRLRTEGIADWYARGSFNNLINDETSSLFVEQEVLMWDAADLNEIVIHEYYVSNTSSQDVNDFKLGFYVDFDLGDFQDDFTVWEDSIGLGYSYDVEGDVYCGIALLSTHNATFNAIDVKDVEDNYLDISNHMSDSVKFNLLSVEKPTAGGAEGQDVAQLLVANIPVFNAYSSEKVAFVLLFGDSLEDLNTKLALAKSKYDEFLLKPDLNWSLHTCEDESVNLSNDYNVKLYNDPLGDSLISSGTQLVLENIASDSVLYFVEEKNDIASDVYKMYIEVSNPVVDFRANPEILYLNDEESNTVQFIDETLSTESWKWSFSNGFLSSAKNPHTFFSDTGIYDVTLDIVTTLGCEAFGVLDFEVQVRGDAPLVDDQLICAGEMFTIEASNSDQLLFYDQVQGREPFYEGGEWQGTAGSVDVIYYVSSIASGVESLKIPVNIVVDPVDALFSYYPDTLNYSGSELIFIQNESVGTDSFEWILNSEIQQSSESLTYDISLIDSLEISLEVSSVNACTSSKTEIVKFTESPKAGININTINQVCKNGYVTSKPINGTEFVFYADEGLTQVIGKGSEAMLGPVTDDTSFYIVNISSYHKSESTELEISTIDFESEVLVSPDSLKYGQAPNVVFEAVSTDDIESYQWYLEDELIEVSSSVTVLFYEIGDYNMKLITENSSECYDTLLYQYKVYQVLNTNLSVNSGLKIHPNPVTKGESIVVDSEFLIREVEIYNALGKLIWTVTDLNEFKVKISSEAFDSGLYVLRARDSSGHDYFNKFIID